MVKNYGGNKNKKFGRKHLQQNNRKLRLKQEDDELYACVTKLLGNGMCHVIGIDNITRLCIIRNKFRGRSKRHNTLVAGSWVLVGVRSWETKTDNKNKLENCDLLEVYSENEKSQLKESIDEKWSTFHGIGDVNSQHESEDTSDYGFTLDDSEIDDETREKLEKDIATEDANTTFIMDNEEINIDDI